VGARDAGGGSSGSGLPAPYRNPWRNLLDDLRAVVADLRLRLWRQWRRNREGGLWRPSWWPLDLAPLFWPLSLALVLVLVLLLVVTPPLLLSRPAAGPAEPAADGVGDAVAPDAVATAASGPSATAQSAPVAPAPTAEVPQSDDAVLPEPVPSTSAASPSASPQPAAIDPQQQLLRGAPAAELLAGAAAEPPSGTLILQIQPPFTALGSAQRQQRAEAWQLYAHDLGFDHLELRDGAGSLLARDALVGSGMIVLPAPPAP